MTFLFPHSSIKPIFQNGKVGELVIYGKKVEPQDKTNPLLQFPLYSIFTIIAVEEGESGYYLLRDSDNNTEFKLQDPYVGVFSNNLFNLKAWVNHQNKQLSDKDKLIEKLQEKIDTYLEIIIALK